MIARPYALVAEDEPTLRVELTAHLWQAGFLVRTASTQERLRLAVYSQPTADVFIISAEFGGYSGGDWLAELARLPSWQAVPVIATTASPESIFAAALRQSQVPVLTEPVDSRSLRQALEKLGLPLREPEPMQSRIALSNLRAVAVWRQSRKLLRARPEVRRPTLSD